jgi:hypothetical protein
MNTIKKIYGYLLVFTIYFGLSASLKAQTVYFTEGFESTNITGASSTVYTTPTSINTGNGNWTFYYSYRAGTFCEGTRGLRLLKNSTCGTPVCNSYAITPIMVDGVQSISFKEPGGQTRSFSIYATSSTTGDATWLPINIITTGGAACATTYTLNFDNYFGTINPASIRRVKIVNESNSDANLDVFTITKPDNPSLSPDAEITAFKINGQIGNEILNYSAGTIAINVALGTNISNLVPNTVSYSTDAIISPATNVAQDFTNPVVYTVTAQDGSIKTWTVYVTAVASSQKEIIAFTLSNSQLGVSAINSVNGTITLNMPNSANLSNLIPQIFQISPSATIIPIINTARNFSSPINYTVTAQDNSTKVWTVTVNLIDPNAVFVDYEAEAAQFTGTVDNNQCH